MATFERGRLMILRITSGAVITCACLVGVALFAPAQAQPGTQQIDPTAFSPAITNPLFPISTIGPRVFEGQTIDPDTGATTQDRLESAVLPETTVVAGVTVTVLEEKAFEDGVLVERALDYFAQHENGDVYYFGERVDNYEDGQLKDHAGQWLAGEDGAAPGVLMPADPRVGVTYEQELAPGIAEDKATVLALDETVRVPAGSYTGCLKTRDFTPLEPDVEEFKWYCPGVGLVQEEGDDSTLQLVSIAPAPSPAATPSPATAAPQATAPSGIAAPATGTGRPNRMGVPLVAFISLGTAALAFSAGVAVRKVR
jgi:hypothetical protein